MPGNVIFLALEMADTALHAYGIFSDTLHHHRVPGLGMRLLRGHTNGAITVIVSEHGGYKNAWEIQTKIMKQNHVWSQLRHI